MKYLKTFESIGDLYDKLKSFGGQGDESMDTYLRQLKAFASIDNLKKLSHGNDISKDFEDYFYDMLDYGWKYYITGGDFVKEIVLQKKLKTEDAENEFNYIVDRMSEIRDRLSDDKFRSQFSINFGGLGQQDINPETHRNDDYKFKGVGNTENGYFDAKIRLTIV